jgi:nucleoside-diphosphate-sugar epimerase
MTNSFKQLLVTGASGFLGSKVVSLAIEEGWQVRALDRSERKPISGVQVFMGDLGDTVMLRKACEGVTAVIHVAGLAHVFGPGAKDSSAFNEVNEVGTRNVVDAALEVGVPHVILVSSVSVYGSYSGAICDESVPCDPQGPYAISKWRGEIKAIERMGIGAGSLTILRFATIYGEGDRGNVAKLISALDRGHFIWPGSGNNQKSLIYRDDAAWACLHALDRTVPGIEIYNVSAQPATMREIVVSICEALGRSVPRLGIPLPLLNAVGAFCRSFGDPGDLDKRLRKFIHDDVYAGEKFEDTFHFRPKISLPEGMRREVNYLRRLSRE